MTVPYLGHLIRVVAISTPPGSPYPDIPWEPIQRLYQTPIVWSQYSDIYLQKSSTTSSTGSPPLPDYDVYADVFGQYEYWDFKLASQWNLGVLRNLDDTATLDPEGVLNYASGYYSGDIPALVEKSAEIVISTSGTHRLDGSNIYRVDTGSLYIGGAVVQRTPNFDPAPALNTQFTLNYNNPDPYTGGSFPPGTGSATYDLFRTFVSGARDWAEYTKI